MDKLLLILSLVLLILKLSKTSDIESETKVLRCCKYGEELSIKKEAANAADDDDNDDQDVDTINNLNNKKKCIKSTSTWVPFIYSPSQKNIIPRVPSNWRIIENQMPDCNDETTLASIPCNTYSPCILFDNGNAIFDTGSGKNIVPGQYCVDSKAILYCSPKKQHQPNNNAVIMRPRVYRCCGVNAIFHEKRHSCFHEEGLENEMPLLKNIIDAEIISGFPHCPNSENFTIVGDVERSQLQSDGSLKLEQIHLPPSQYCIERIKELNGRVKVFACSEHATERIAVEKFDVRFMIYPISLIISSIFLTATLATGWLLPASHHALHWRCQTHHVLCLLLGDLLMAVIQLAGDALQGNSCKVFAIMAHFFFLAAFFWLNTMCFNIWWTFRDLRPASLEKSQEMLRLKLYACYAWGGPLLVAGLAAILDHLPTEYNNIVRPRFGEKRCWFYGDNEIFAYFFGPIGILLAINIVFFVATARELTCGLWKGEFVKSTTERAALGRVCLKLVIVMGVTWIADVISWASGGPNYLWYFTDLFNALQGLFIFIVVSWQPQVRAGLKRLFNINPRSHTERQGNGLSTSSHGMPSINDSVTQNPSTKTAPLETIC